MYAAIFVCCVQGIFTSKVKYWQMFHKNNISREIKRLELRIAELNDIILGKCRGEKDMYSLSHHNLHSS
jgi:hypothetical protein